MMMLPTIQRRQVAPNFLDFMSSLSSSLYRLVRVFVVSFIFCQHTANCSSTSSSSLTASSPIRNFEPSWAASCAQGTTIALSYPRKNEKKENAIILLLRSASGKSDSGLSSSIDTNPRTGDSWREIDGLRISRQSSDSIKRYDASHRWTLLGNEALCCMTGLASDVDYLSRILQKQVDIHRIIYESTLEIPALKVVRNLAKQLQEAAQNQGGRPYGIQSLVVGRSSTTRSSLNMYSLDPSGGFRHWSSATAIGRNAQNVRKQLHKAISDREPSNGVKALETALQASLDAMREAFVNTDSDRYEALYMWQENGQLCVGMVDPEQIRDSLKLLQNNTDSSPA